MAITWEIKTEIVNTETDLRKIHATRVNDVAGTSQSFFVKGVVKTPDDQKKLEDDIWAQYQAAKTKAEAVDMKKNLESKEPAA